MQLIDHLKIYPHIVLTEQNEESCCLRTQSSFILQSLESIYLEYQFTEPENIFEDYSPVYGACNQPFSSYFETKFPNSYENLQKIYHSILARIVEFQIKKKNQKQRNQEEEDVKKISFKFYYSFEIFKFLKLHIICDGSLSILQVNYIKQINFDELDVQQVSEPHIFKESLSILDLSGKFSKNINLVLADQNFQSIFDMEKYQNQNFFEMMSKNSQKSILEKYGHSSLFLDKLSDQTSLQIDYSIFSKKKLQKRVKRINFLNNNSNFRNYIKNFNIIEVDDLFELSSDQLSYLRYFKPLQSQAFISKCIFQNQYGEIEVPVIILLTYSINDYEIKEHFQLIDTEITTNIEMYEKQLQEGNEKFYDLF